MKFHVIERSERIPLTAQTVAYLRKDNWNDFSFQTLFRLEVVEKQKKIDIGLVKIAFREQTTTTPTYHKLNDTFTELTNDFFSLGESADYYQNLKSLTPQTKKTVLTALNDLANNPDVINQIRDEEVLKTSLLRDHSLTTVKGEFSRIILDQPKLTNFKFTFSRTKSEEMGGIELNFNVDKETNPPSNIHALIGRNGSGKTTILNGIISTITGTNCEPNCTLYERVRRKKIPISQDYFSSLVSVSFSAFDPFTPPKDQPNPSKGTCYFYIGLQDPDNERRLRSIDDLRHDFIKSLVNCFRKRSKRQLWKDTICKLNSDENFEQMNLRSMYSDYVDLKRETEGQVDSRVFRAKLLDLVLPKLNSLSSGHSIVLFTLTQLVAKTEEKTLVLIDEPEGHLHPPLLSAFLRALSDLLFNLNAVAIIATHSPVVLQEIPKRSVWVINRVGKTVEPYRPEHETFGENVGVLTREIFRLEVKNSGYHQLLKDSVGEGGTYDNILESYKNRLGLEGRAILKALILKRDKDID
ncbi:hypothetical protein DC365_13805 [Vibrio vulnificus]|uniref:AAA family ATPase n=1 Tax=Vibrio TaxID=662 RepID=UPI000D3EB911|nr:MULTISPECIES: AAA family ATPase [Vibrio]EGQ9880129.1 AAA family ATPase [Vibrio vulnificus]ELH3005133.1 AAA family ATPase [Vibrio vulnificus]ELK8326723.1 AAA family ATPase [Vibrio vulnificus]ELN6895452.1 AAA family ATPase [Vibrio vulnificus]ELU0080184.1 AAA family ATPase [Vibrio vulnificus]